MNVLITGGCKNGKTAFALRLAEAIESGGKKFYVATMIPADGEDRERIRRHKKEREGRGFKTLEAGRDIARCLEKAPAGSTFLLDSVTALLANEMFPSPFTGFVDYDAGARCAEGLLALAEKAGNAILVSDCIFQDAAFYDATTESYRQSLAHIERALAKASDLVIELCAGNVLLYKGTFSFRFEDRSGLCGIPPDLKEGRKAEDNTNPAAEAEPVPLPKRKTCGKDGQKMVFIIGGAYQGKLAFAKETFGIETAKAYTCTENGDIDFSASCIYGIERFVLFCVRNGLDATGQFARRKAEWKDSVLICQDIFCGVVPMDAELRAWREMAGRLCAYLSREAGAVYRVFCGLGIPLKGNL